MMGLLSSASAGAQQGSIEFAMSRKQAEENVPYLGGPWKLHDTKGAAEGPFAWVGEVEANAEGFEKIATRQDGRTSYHSGGLNDPEVVFKAVYYVNAKGDSFVVRYRRTVEDAGLPEKAKEQEEEEDDRPYQHRQLCEAAMFGISEGNVNLIEALLQAGLMINEPLDWDTRWTSLHYAALGNQPDMVQVLLDNGASRDSRGKYGQRPIDYALDDGATAVCELLRKPEQNEKTLGDFSRPLVDEVLGLPSWEIRSEEVAFFTINGQDPDLKWLKYLRRRWPNARTRSRAEELSWEAAKKAGGDSCYRDRDTGEFGQVMELSIESDEEAEDGATTFDYSLRQATGPALAGGGTGGKVTFRYGYWVKHDTFGWDE